jgi:hypothetical protein
VKVGHLEIYDYVACREQEEIVVAAHGDRAAYELWLPPSIRLEHRKGSPPNALGDPVAPVGDVVGQHGRSKT